MHQHPLNARFQRHGARVASTTASLQLDLHDPVLSKPPILNIPAILHDRRPHARVQQLLDHRDRIRVRVQNPRVLRARVRPVLLGAEQRLDATAITTRRRRGKVLHQDGVHLGLDDRPRVLPVLRHGDKVRPVKDGLDALDAEQAQREGGRERRARVEELGRARLHHGHAGDELERVPVRRRLRLYEHGPAFSAPPRGQLGEREQVGCWRTQGGVGASCSGQAWPGTAGCSGEGVPGLAG